MALNYADLKLLSKGLDYTRRNRNWVVALGALGVTGYGAYRAYYSPSMVRKRKRFLKLISAFVSLAEMVADSADVIGIVSKDLKEFISSDSDQIPRSLKQISKIAKSDEFSQSIVKVTSALTVGVVRGYQQETAENGVSGAANSGLFDQVLDKLFTDAGSGFASVIVGSFARNLVLAYCSDKKGNATDSDIEHSVPGWADVLCQDKCRELIGNCIQLFVSTAVAVYLDRTMNINTYNEIFSGLTNPKHETKMRDMLVAICSGAIGTFVKTSHQVLTNSDMDTTSEMYSSLPLSFKAKKFLDEDENMYTGWTNRVSSTLAVPRNRRFILDLTGRVTFESVRSFLEFLLEKLYECVRKSIDVVQEEVVTLRRSVDVIQEEVVDRSSEACRYVSGKSSTAVSVCLALCLHILNGPWILVPN
ncbi:protein PHLOEM PROTEIN 2-LIKE A10-like [Solanum stenotomum]|uniref:protein PHLOEM PROTEIN 2-LIKE A10-like n=1 Tax=Solanum stenotomum TaxID=172797 RepID=UPI0020D0B550|nr:protein PHLOEM PROTEIN 2-LIKE A10-like [Solanum stenotomum]